MKYSLLLLPLFFALVSPISARTDLASTSARFKPETSPGLFATSSAQKRQEKLTAALEALRQRGIQEITRRIAALTRVTQALREMKRLSASDLTSLTTQVQAEIAALTTLQTQLSSATDAATLRSQVKSIVTSYRTYVLYLPKIHLLAAADRLTSVLADLPALVTKLEQAIQTAKAAGQNVTADEASLAIIRTKIPDAITKTQAAQEILLTLKPEEYPGNKSALQTAQTNIKTALADLRAIRHEANSIISRLKTFQEKLKLAPKTTSSLTPSPTATPTVTPSTTPTP